MGKYFVHKLRKPRPEAARVAPIDLGSILARETELAALRDSARAEREQARMEKKGRADARAASRRHYVDLDRSGRRRTAARAAGLVLISATAGVRTQEISIFRPAGASPCSLWGAKIDFDIEAGFTHYLDDPTAPPEADALHAMRALAPGIAEQLLLREWFDDGADGRNRHWAQRLAESYMRKAYRASSLSSGQLVDLSQALLRDFQQCAEGRLRHFRAELERLVDALTEKPRIAHKECDELLAPVYAGFDEHYRLRPKPQLFRPPQSGAESANSRNAPRA